MAEIIKKPGGIAAWSQTLGAVNPSSTINPSSSSALQRFHLCRGDKRVLLAEINPAKRSSYNLNPICDTSSTGQNLAFAATLVEPS
ncbi:hypothetical protein [Jiulongibacter sediminis]|uniref:hypothetical protein n=1 Tax=Jiulongibacter sediminis TaxID=1605367 RepID=UPI001040B375|nr:hypothetical protein [Jiulongibacter sediminis]